MGESNNKRIAKNTLLLYFRMLFLVVVSLYTGRVVLDTLGVEDYGIYNVVGGVVLMFSMLSGSLSAAITRFITFELGRGDLDKLKRTFSSAVTIQIALGIVIVVLVEIFGVWFLNSKMNIPESRISAANWVLQFSTFTFFVNLISIPYNATIIAHERFSAFAGISIVEGLGKLAIAFLIIKNPFDRLVYYALLMMVLALFLRIIYGYYCVKHFDECHYSLIWDKDLLKSMFGFTGWNFIGSTSAILRDQGGNIIINLFCGPAVNAARGVALQVSHAIQGFVSSFQTALNPQITKSYAIGNNEYMLRLICQGARISYYMLLLLSLPVIVNTPYVLGLWLKEVPEHTASFVQLILLFALSESISGPLVTAMLATGNIRNYQLIVGGMQMMNLPISYLLLRWGFCPETVIIVSIVVSQCCLALRLLLLRNMIGLSIRFYLRNVYINVVVISLISSVLPVILTLMTSDSMLKFIWLTLTCVLITALTEFYVGCNKNERSLVVSYCKRAVNKVHHAKK